MNNNLADEPTHKIPALPTKTKSVNYKSIKEILREQLELLAERSKESGANLSGITMAMISLVSELQKLR